MNVTKNGITEFVMVVMAILIVMFFFDFVGAETGTFAVASGALFLYLVNFAVIFSQERKYEHNQPYKPYKSRKSFLSRAITGFVGGFNYFFYIGGYNHKKYNTQVWYPVTMESLFGSLAEFIMMLAYFILATKLYSSLGYYTLLIFLIPIVTNIISIIRK